MGGGGGRLGFDRFWPQILAPGVGHLTMEDPELEKQVLVSIKERSRVVKYVGDLEQLKDALFTTLYTYIQSTYNYTESNSRVCPTFLLGIEWGFDK